MLFSPISKKDQASQDAPGVKRLSMDCKATVKLGASRAVGKLAVNTKRVTTILGAPNNIFPVGSLMKIPPNSM